MYESGFNISISKKLRSYIDTKFNISEDNYLTEYTIDNSNFNSCDKYNLLVLDEEINIDKIINYILIL